MPFSYQQSCTSCVWWDNISQTILKMVLGILPAIVDIKDGDEI